MISPSENGSDVALVLVRSGGSWTVRQRYLTGGLDDQVAGRFAYTGTPRNLALVSTRDGSTLTAVRADGTQETESWYYSRDPFGKVDQLVGTGGTISSETGFTGASTPNQTGGFVYLRNRWYDPGTGRFLTQDPIGLAGGVNLYAYAGNNPVAYTDPFGLCPLKKDGIPCSARFINGAHTNNQRLVGALNSIAAEQDRTLFVYSALRTSQHNREVGGADDSPHVRDQAADVIFAGMNKTETVDALFHSTARKESGLRLLYHGPEAAVAEHSHLDFDPGPDAKEISKDPKSGKRRFIPLADPVEHP